MIALNIQNVFKTYQTNSAIRKIFHKNTSKDINYVLNNINLKIEQGEFFGLLGPNGAGKTTLISILAGLIKYTKGQISVCGYDLSKNHKIIRRLIGIVPQELVFDPFFNVIETLKLQSGYFGIKNNDKWIKEILENLGLAEKSYTNMRYLSGGMKRRVLVAQALVHKPPIIILDEPTAGVDINLRKTLWDFIVKLNKNGHTILLTTHYLEEAESLCNRIAILKKGNIIALDKIDSLIINSNSKDLDQFFTKITQ
ncbi:Daunorubicin/doxorubicin resistance ATP-binding protein DrrA [Candidatus Kinetoplastibacterium sorsogonicusi]|uniref:Daunorubicin/doxorubicin resistance ATP-binding protein DrrA n=1 Tax=Candidatus Kinetoplastidibacterium kentomonadis TaxID=1576550 RepID=A0A3Q8F335_9PROT|nr:ABC transporter ATP-binding protein [Candidatus Kinetoplastibacterium sorsogonicusi]AWD32174.1 Daunorubicin/doxorubicin resistance ATP-binding protein DrrA [Candidatus Kinetoplastibacterium sorsogonicusi]